MRNRETWVDCRKQGKNKAIEKKTPNKLAVERGCEFLQKT